MGYTVLRHYLFACLKVDKVHFTDASEAQVGPRHRSFDLHTICHMLS